MFFLSFAIVILLPIFLISNILRCDATNSLFSPPRGTINSISDVIPFSHFRKKEGLNEELACNDLLNSRFCFRKCSFADKVRLNNFNRLDTELEKAIDRKIIKNPEIKKQIEKIAQYALKKTKEEKEKNDKSNSGFNEKDKLLFSDSLLKFLEVSFFSNFRFFVVNRFYSSEEVTDDDMLVFFLLSIAQTFSSAERVIDYSESEEYKLRKEKEERHIISPSILFNNLIVEQQRFLENINFKSPTAYRILSGLFDQLEKEYDECFSSAFLSHYHPVV